MDGDAIFSVLKEAVEAGEIPGAAVGVVGAKVVEVCVGNTALGGASAITPETVFWIASMTKPVTSVAAMQLMERGVFGLETPAEVFLPELGDCKILEGGALRPAARKITVGQLLTHTSGFSYPFMSEALTAHLKGLPEPPAPGTKAALKLPLLFEPGERWEYGVSTDWLGLLVEAASGVTLDRYFAEHIFAPLGMGDTSFTPNAEQQARQAMLHQREADGRIVPKRLAAPFAEHFCSGGGGLFSTLRDYGKFLQMFLKDGAGVLAPGRVAEMARNHIGGLRAGWMPSANPVLMAGRDVNPGMESKFGLGFLIYPERRGNLGRYAGSFGWSGMANTYFWVDPEAGIGVVVMMQMLPSGDEGVIKTIIRLEKAIYK